MRVLIVAVVLIAVAGDCLSGFALSTVLAVMRPVTVHAEFRTYCMQPDVFVPCAEADDPDDVLEL